MISFTPFTRENSDALTGELGRILADTEYVREILASFLEILDEGVEIALTNSHGCLLVRIFDSGKYSFVYPIAISESADCQSAFIDIVNYSIRELIPVYVTDTPREEIDFIVSTFPHAEAHAYDEDVDSFAVIISSECDMLDEVPTHTADGVTLSPITERDLARYAELCRSEAVNRYWGYDYKDDVERDDDAYFLSVQESEFMRGVALSLAIRIAPSDELVGEAVLFDFDYRGAAMAAIRLHKDTQGRGVGSRSLAALIELANRIGLKTLRAEVMLENAPSVRMTEKQMTRLPDKDGKAQFVLNFD